MGLMGTAGTLIEKAKAEVAQFDDENPRTAGRIRQVVGGVLIADGLVGLENPFDGEKSRPGILGAALGIVGGIAALVFGIFTYVHAPDPDASTTGTITGVVTTTDDDGDKTCDITAEFTVDGQTYTGASASSDKDLCQYRDGSSIKVDYEAADPAENVVGNSEKKVAVLLGIFGVLAFIVSVITFVIRAASIYFGWKLWRAGSKMVKANPDTGEDEQVVAEVKKKFTALITGTRRRSKGLGSMLSGLKR